MIENIIEDLNNLLVNGLDGSEDFYNLVIEANKLGFRIKFQGKKLVAVKQ